MSPLYKVAPEGGHQSVLPPGEQDIHWFGLEVLRLEAGESWEGALADEEAAMVILSGGADISVDNGKNEAWTGLGARGDVFSGSATAVYAPRKSNVSVTATSTLEVAIAKTPCDVDLPAALIQPEDVKVVSSGMANWRRDVRLVIPPGSPISQRLIVGETLNPPGNWSGIPPHKHDQVTDVENFLEEFYFFKVSPADNYGLQLMYKDGEGQGHIVGNDDVTVMLSGYHPTVASPGTTICYLWVLAGEDKGYKIAIDPRFGWVGSAEAVLKEEQRG
ncbi:MAG: 5-deoxy-glucuronate isomerase [Anaerolineales bacterium]